MDSSKLITLGIVGVGLYLIYEFLISQCETVNSGLYGSSTCSMLLGTTALPAVTVPSVPTTTASATTATATIANNQTTAQTLAALLSGSAGETGNLTPDQWSYYYQSIPGKPNISAGQFENILGSLGLSDATRSTQVSAQQFANAAVSQGLSGLNTAKLYAANWVPAFGGWA